MEDNNFWDELARRLRQEQPQPFQEEDWATVHRQLRVKRKRRAGWLWPMLTVLAFLANNLIWWLLWQQPKSDSRQNVAQRDTIYLIQERIVHDTMWRFSTQTTGTNYLPAPTRDDPDQPVPIFGQDKISDKTVDEPPPAKKTVFTPTLSISDQAQEPATNRHSDNLFMPLPLRFQIPDAPPRMILVSEAHIQPVVPHRSPKVFLAAEAGNAWFLASGTSRAYLRQFGASFHVLSGQWGAVAGFRRWYAAENPKQTAATLGLPDECENCPVAGYPDQVRLQWTEFQLGLVYQLPLNSKKTNIYLSALGQLRGAAEQYRHFHFEQYNSPPIEIEDRYQEKSGLYWNGCSGKVSVAQRLMGRLSLYGTLEGRWPAGVNPRLTPPAVGLNLGLAWHFRS